MKRLSKILLAFFAGFLSVTASLTFSWRIHAQLPNINPIVQTQPDANELIERGRTLYEQGQLSTAVTVLEQAVVNFVAQGDALRQAMALSNLALVYQQLGQWTQAEKAIQNSLEQLQNRPNLGDSTNQLQVLAQTLDIQGRLQFERGQTQTALETWQSAAKIYAQIGDTTGKNRSLMNQAEALQSLGLYSQSCRILLQSLGVEHQECNPSNNTLQTLAQQSLGTSDIGFIQLKAIQLRSLGDVLRAVGALEKSEEVLTQSLEIVKTLPVSPEKHREESSISLSLGNTFRAKGDREIALQQSEYSEPSVICKPKLINQAKTEQKIDLAYKDARQYYEKAIQLANQHQLLTVEIQALLNFFRLLLETQQWDEAYQLLPAIRSKLEKLPLSKTSIDAQINYAQSLACLQGKVNNTPSWLDIAQLMAVSTQQAQQLQDKRLETYGRGNLGWVYEQTRQWLPAEAITQQALAEAQAMQAWDSAYQWAWQLGRIYKAKGEEKEAITAYETAFKTLQLLRRDLASLNRDVQFSFRDEVEPIYRQFVDLLLQSDNPSQENLKQARDVIEALQLAELENFFREACLQAKPEQIDQIVEQSDATAAVFYPIILKDRIEIILKLPGKPLRHHSVQVAGSKVEETINQLRESLKEPDKGSTVRQQAQQVYDWLIQPFESDLEVAADWRTSQVKTLVFVLDGALRNIPMAVLYDNQRQRYLVERYAIAVAPGLQLLDSKPLPKGQFNALLAGVSQERQIENRTFAPLPNVTYELQQIRELIRHHQELPNGKFIPQNFQNQLESARFSVVHLATHGKFSSNPDETFIVTWNDLLRVKDLDSLLRLSNQNGSSTIELLVLSACQTALGDKRAALGLAGVAARAGARSTIATLWQVNDASTAQLMIQFYQQLFTRKNQLTKAEALRQAQLAILNNARYKSPYYWAPFILVGNWS